MEYLIMWLLTTVISIVFELKNELRLFKDVADEGYKVDIERMAEIDKQINTSSSKINFLSLIIPIYNIVFTAKKIMDYNDIRPFILDSLRVVDLIEEMSKEEQEAYQKRPTGINALIITAKKYIEKRNMNSIVIKTDNGRSEIFYSLDNNAPLGIKIIKVEGEASDLSEEELKILVISTYCALNYANIKKEQASSKNSKVDLGDGTKVDVKDNFITFSQEKEQLEALRKELLNLKNSSFEDEKEALKEKDKTLVKKK